MTREEVIALCDAAVRPESTWFNRDSAAAQMQVGELRALLMSGCEFVKEDQSTLDKRTHWITVSFKGFNYFEEGDLHYSTFYLPTQERLDQVGEGDWYC